MAKRNFLIIAGFLFTGAAFLVWRDSKNKVQNNAYENSPQVDISGASLPAPGFIEKVKKIMSDIVNTLSNNGLNLIKRIETFSAKPYRDARGWSIGYGHYMGGTATMSSVTLAQAEKLLSNDTESAQAVIRALVRVPLSQNQFDALTSFVYNVGAGAFGKSTLLRLLNNGDMSGAAGQFTVWNKMHNTDGDLIISSALVARREAEQTIFNS